MGFWSQMDHDTPLKEHEITSAMIEAGEWEVVKCLGASELLPPMTERELATRVFQAILAARRT